MMFKMGSVLATVAVLGSLAGSSVEVSAAQTTQHDHVSAKKTVKKTTHKKIVSKQVVKKATTKKAVQAHKVSVAPKKVLPVKVSSVKVSAAKSSVAKTSVVNHAASSVKPATSTTVVKKPVPVTPATKVNANPWMSVDEPAFAKVSQIWKTTVPAASTAAITWYAGNDGYVKINDYLRGITKTADAQTTAATAAIHNAVTTYNNPKTTVVYRGVSAKGLQISLHNAPLQVGALYSDKAFMSTSFDKGVAFDFAKDPSDSYVLQMTIPAGTGHGAYIAPLSKEYGLESEYLVKDHSEFKVTGFSTLTGNYNQKYHVVEMTMVK
ncbi:ADP-ribosyltransferase [Weissella cibaria]|uniref:ADP-ribosyltransferase n=1 Tax=Weissella cibaria TaxID=137591 RepID=UPI0022DEFE43|nr:ADP-ribosyltransferase [Weissella cibaria]